MQKEQSISNIMVCFISLCFPLSHRIQKTEKGKKTIYWSQGMLKLQWTETVERELKTLLQEEDNSKNWE